MQKSCSLLHPSHGQSHQVLQHSLREFARAVGAKGALQRSVLHLASHGESRLRYRSRFAKDMYNQPQIHWKNVHLNLNKAAGPPSI